jgi:hypothetical protein
MLHNILNTKAMLQIKNFFMDDYSCIMGDVSGLETRNHLFCLYPFAHICWQYLCPTWVPPQSFIDSLKTSLKEPFFMEIIILTAWSIGLRAMI